MKESNYPGKFIVFEGLDGAGTESQTALWLDYLRQQKKPAERIRYPDYEGPIGRLIHEYLHQKYDFSVEVQFLLYFTDFVKDVEKINEWLREGKTVIADRYFTSTIAYQGLRGFSEEKALKLAEFFNLPNPDLIVYLKVSSEVSIKRKFKEKGSLDRNEKDKEFLVKLSGFYENLIEKKAFGEWILIDGEKSIQEVFEDTKKIIFNKFKI